MATPSTKRILFITREVVPFFYGGIGTQFLSMIKFLKNRGHAVFLLTQRHLNFDGDAFRREYGETPVFFVSSSENGGDVPPETLNSEEAPVNFSYALAVLGTFDRIYKTVQPDIVFVADYEAEGLFLLLKSRSGSYRHVRFVLVIGGLTHDVLSTFEGANSSAANRLMEKPQNRLTCAMEEMCIALADEIVVPTHRYWNQVRRRLKIDRAVRIIPNFIDRDTFDYQHSVGIEQPVFSDTAYILFVGRLDRHKGADILLEAYLDAVQSVPRLDARLLMIGRDCFCKDYRRGFREYWQEKIPSQLADRIEFLGQVEHAEIATYYQRASLCVFPSRWEVFGIVCLEAMFSGCPVIVSKGTGLEEILGPDLSGFAIDISDRENRCLALKEKMIAVLDGGQNKGQIGARFKKRAVVILSTAAASLNDLVENQPLSVRSDGLPAHNLFFEKNIEMASALHGSIQAVIKAHAASTGTHNPPANAYGKTPPSKLKRSVKKIVSRWMMP